MIRFIQRRFAIRSYVWKLSQELLRRFGKKKFYSVDEVTQAAERGQFSTAFIAYAHAIFCARHDFESHYSALLLACTYDGLRADVSRRYLGGVVDFDAAQVIAATRKEGIAGGFHESGEGEHAGGH